MKVKPDWQPIATAPKSGDEIIIWCKEGYTVEGFWSPLLHDWAIPLEEGFFAFTRIEGTPTHWCETIELEGP